jgi:GT2 family glycosyltransferase
VPVSAAPRVLAVLVTHDGAAWLPDALDALEAQTYGAVDVLAVDNASTDGSRILLTERLGHDRVLVADRDLGFGAAVAMALDADPGGTDLIWLLHDDLTPEPEALATLVDAMADDPRLAIVGPKLRSWDRPENLQSVGWTIDLTGRADSGVDPDELDQGQRDQRQRALYLSTAGMLIRREAFDHLGGFDRRFHLFRDDLDLCWRAWIAGYEVEVEPEAVAHHVSAAAEYVRLGQTRFIGPRYFAERNTLASLLKNYGAARLPIVVVLYLVVGVAKVFGFLLTRRVSDAWQTVRAWIWNIVHLRETLRFRRRVQQLRRRTDRELRDLFGRVAPRVRAYVEAIASWIAGGDHGVVAPEPPPGEVEDTAPEPGLRRVVRRVRERPIMVASLLLLVLVGVGAWPLFTGAELRGGDLAPWPASPTAFLSDYAAGWSEAGAFGTDADPSPAQAILGLLHLLVGGSSFLAPRVLILGSFAVAWVFALRAAQIYARRRIPRVVAATAYVLSPPALAALATGEVGALIVFALLPGVVAAMISLVRPRNRPEQAWRAVSGVAILGAIAGAFEPIVLPTLLVVGTLVILGSLLVGPVTSWHWNLAIRVVVATVGPIVLLLPWSWQLVAPDGPLLGASGQLAGGEAWRWLLMSPEMVGFPGILAGVGFLLAGLLGLMLGTTRTPGFVAVLWTAALTGAIGAWWLGRTGEITWPGLPLLLTAAAFAGLFALAFASAEASLSRFGFGWRQVAAAATAVGVAASLVIVAADLVRGPWDAYAVDDPPLPAFIGSAAVQDPFRVLVLADTEDAVQWEVVDGGGPTMAAYGVPPSPVLETIGDLVRDALDRRDPQALSQLGPLNVRFVFVPSGATSDLVDEALRAQVGLAPRPLAGGRLFQVAEWMPPASLVPDRGAADLLEERGVLPEGADALALRRDDDRVYRARPRVGGTIVVADADAEHWVAEADGRRLERLDDLPIRFEAIEDASAVEVWHDGGPARRVAVTGQILMVLLAISLALRPPSFARRREATEGARTVLPQEVAR